MYYDFMWHIGIYSIENCYSLHLCTMYDQQVKFIREKFKLVERYHIVSLQIFFSNTITNTDATKKTDQ